MSDVRPPTEGELQESQMLAQMDRLRAENERLRKNWNIVRLEAIRALKYVRAVEKTLALMQNQEREKLDTTADEGWGSYGGSDPSDDGRRGE